jgi:hypothetical protein
VPGRSFCVWHQDTIDDADTATAAGLSKPITSPLNVEAGKYWSG